MHYDFLVLQPPDHIKKETWAEFATPIADGRRKPKDEDVQ